MDGWKMNFLFGRPIFRGYVSFRECSTDEPSAAETHCCLRLFYFLKLVLPDDFAAAWRRPTATAKILRALQSPSIHVWNLFLLSLQKKSSNGM